MSSANGTKARADFDLAASRKAAVAEATQVPFTFSYDADHFTVPPMDDWPLAVSEKLNEGDLAGGLQLLLGDEQWQRFRDLAPTMGDVRRLFEALAPWAGVENLGNSSAPPQRGSTPT